MNLFELNELPNGNSNCNVFECRAVLLLFASFLVGLTAAKFYCRLLKKLLAFTNCISYFDVLLDNTFKVEQKVKYKSDLRVTQ